MCWPDAARGSFTLTNWTTEHGFPSNTVHGGGGLSQRLPYGRLLSVEDPRRSSDRPETDSSGYATYRAAVRWGAVGPAHWIGAVRREARTASRNQYGLLS
jgi:hypothetical protein